ncbi:hypothetical protein EMGBS15_16060 [Filimonas sp.]|nr:hypothetical protein EMGBS15_16060 [Filimonas sp.]
MAVTRFVTLPLESDECGKQYDHMIGKDFEEGLSNRKASSNNRLWLIMKCSLNGYL